MPILNSGDLFTRLSLFLSRWRFSSAAFYTAGLFNAALLYNAAKEERGLTEFPPRFTGQWDDCLSVDVYVGVLSVPPFLATPSSGSTIPFQASYTLRRSENNMLPRSRLQNFLVLPLEETTTHEKSRNQTFMGSSRFLVVDPRAKIPFRIIFAEY